MRANLNELADVADLYEALSRQLVTLMGPAAMLPRAHAAATRDGKGILFVAYDGEINPAGFLTLPLGNVRDETIAPIHPCRQFRIEAQWISLPTVRETGARSLGWRRIMARYRSFGVGVGGRGSVLGMRGGSENRADAEESTT